MGRIELGRMGPGWAGSDLRGSDQTGWDWTRADSDQTGQDEAELERLGSDLGSIGSDPESIGSDPESIGASLGLWGGPEATPNGSCWTLLLGRFSSFYHGAGLKITRRSPGQGRCEAQRGGFALVPLLPRPGVRPGCSCISQGIHRDQPRAGDGVARGVSSNLPEGLGFPQHLHWRVPGAWPLPFYTYLYVFVHIYIERYKEICIYEHACVGVCTEV